MQSTPGILAFGLLAALGPIAEADEAAARKRLKELGAVVTTGDQQPPAVSINLNVSKTTDVHRHRGDRGGAPRLSNWVLPSSGANGLAEIN